MEETPKGVVSPVVQEFTPSGNQYYIRGKSSKSILKEFSTLKEYLDYCSKLESMVIRYCEFHPNPFNNNH